MRESRADGKPVCSVIVQRNNKNDSNYSDPSLYKDWRRQNVNFCTKRYNLNQPWRQSEKIRGRDNCTEISTQESQINLGTI